MDTQDTQNCWEPIIHEKEGVINAFVKEALDSLEERLMENPERTDPSSQCFTDPIGYFLIDPSESK
jgi:hypothetical protein